jgi:predicted nucleic acid-binding protein
VQYIADAGFIAGFWDKNDKVRNWARAIAERHPGPHLTCEPVLIEAAYLVGASRIARALTEGDYLVDFSWQAHAAEVLELLERYSDREMDVADACTLLLAQANPGLKVLTVDRKDFTIYRTLKGNPVHCQFPPD